MKIFTAVILLGAILALSMDMAFAQADSRDIGTDQANVSQILQSAVAQQSASTQINQTVIPSGPVSVSQVANTSQIFSINKGEAMNITAINYVGGQWVQIANIGISNRNLTGWRLVNREGRVYTFPNIILPVNGVVRVHQGSGMNTFTDLYTGSMDTLVSGASEVITLTDNSGRLIARYQNPQPSVASAQDLAPPSGAVTGIAGPAALPVPTPGAVPVVEPVETTGMAMPVDDTGNLVNTSPEQGAVINQDSTAITAGGPEVTVSGV